MKRQIIDECGKWDVVEGEGFVSRSIVEPTDTYYDMYPEFPEE